MPCCVCEGYGWERPREEGVAYTDPVDGKDYCLFHAPAEHKSVSVDVFNRLVLERLQATLDLEDETAKCNLSGTVFPGDIDFEDYKFPSVDFSEALFTGRAYFENASFGVGSDFFQARFERRVAFAGASFEGGHSSKKPVSGGTQTSAKPTLEGMQIFERSTSRGEPISIRSASRTYPSAMPTSGATWSSKRPVSRAG